MPSVADPPDVKRQPSAEAALRGEPSYVWRSGQERRLELIRRYVKLEDARILDVGAGIGTYVRRFRAFSPHVYGIDVEVKRLVEGSKSVPRLLAAAAERLPFRDSSFDVLVFNEVIEHVADDRRTIEDALRVCKAGGHIVIYAPNRLYPFETHGIYWKGAYRFGNIPPGELAAEPVPERAGSACPGVHGGEHPPALGGVACAGGGPLLRLPGVRQRRGPECPAGSRPAGRPVPGRTHPGPGVRPVALRGAGEAGGYLITKIVRNSAIHTTSTKCQ